MDNRFKTNVPGEVSRPWAAFSQWQSTGKWFRYRNHSIFCQIEGEGEPLVLLHGFPTASWDWHRVWVPLREHYRLIAIDMIGFGFSDKPPDFPYALTDQADMVAGFLEQMEVKSVHFLAHDYGNSVVQELMARALKSELPFRIKSVCFLNGGLFPEMVQPVFVQQLLSSPLGPLVSRLINKDVFIRNMRHLFSDQLPPDTHLLEELWRTIEYNNGRRVLHELIHYMEERRCHRHRWVNGLVDSVRDLGLPVSFVCGTESPVSGYAMIGRYESLVPTPYVVPLRGVGHYPHLEVPEQVVTNYLQFRERAEQGRRPH